MSRKYRLFAFFIAKLKPETRLTIIKEYRGDGFKYSVRDFIAGMMGNSSWCYGRFMSPDDALKCFPSARYRQ
jgi:hypothetical protein